ncbi:MAG TPA: peptidylprolyl isomerase [bacterium]|nr:peptidylprolyl isomerase [bacterium]
MTMLRYIAIFFIATGLSACGDDGPAAATDSAADLDAMAPDDAPDAADDALATDDLLPDDDTAPAVTRHAVLETTLGDITIGLYGDAMPVTSGNFETYIEEGFFTGLIFHRVVPGFVIQGGGYDAELVPKETHDPIDFERNPAVRHVKYAVSMARTANIDSATSQFFITLDAQPRLDYDSDDDFENKDKYPCAAFGIVTDGFEVVDAIGAVETSAQNGLTDVPVTPVVITAASFADQGHIR